MPPPPSDTKPWCSTYKIYIMRTSGLLSLEGGGMPSPLLRLKTLVLRRRWGVGSPLPLPRHETAVLGRIAVEGASPSRPFAPRPPLLCHTTDKSAVSHGRCVYCVTQLNPPRE